MDPSRPQAACLRARLAAALLAAAALGAAPAHAADHVLVLTISEYARSPLQGVVHDAANALRLARRLGYDTSRPVVLKDRQLTGAGLRAAFSALVARVQRNDRVFVYYSGHGFSVPQRGSCVQGLVAQDETLVPTAELSAQLDEIKTRVSDALVIFDACFSGGNRDLGVTRALPPGAADVRSGDPPLRAKVWTPRGGERCEVPVNELAKGWEPPDTQQLTRALVFPKSNFTFIAAATEREVALDDRERGGLATLGLMQCADDGVPSATGLVTVGDLASCAQRHVDRNVKGINARLQAQEYLPHQLMVYGNGERLFPLGALPAPVAAAATPAAAVSGEVSAGTVAVPAAGGQADRVLAAFRRFAASSNGNWGLRLEPSAPAAPIGRPLRLRYQTNQGGYVQLLYVGSDRREIARIWPAEGRTRRLEAGEGELPINLTLTAPAGENTVLMVLSQQPLDLAPILRGGTAAASTAVLQQLGCELGRQRNLVVKEDSAPPPGCAPAGTAAGSGAPASEGIDGYTARTVTLTGLP